MPQQIKFSKPQRLITCLLVGGTLLMGIAVSDSVLEGLDVRYDSNAHFIFGFFGAFTIAGAIVVRYFLDVKNDQNSR